MADAHALVGAPVDGAVRRGPPARAPAPARRHVLAEGLRPADEALPRRLPLLHVRPAAAARRARLPDARTRCSRSRAPARRRAATRRSSRSATSPSCATAPPATSSPRSAARRRSSTSRRCAGLVLEETGLLPHLNPGVMSREDVRALREVSASQGLMLETTAERLSERGGPHFGSPDKLPAARLATIEAAGLSARAVHDRDPDRDRRDPGRADRRAARDPRARRAARPRPGGDRPELPRQAGHAHGRPPGAAARRAAVDGRGGPRRARPGVHVQCPPNLSLRRLPAPARRRDRRLGRRLAGDDRPRQPGGAVARDRAAARARPRSAGSCSRRASRSTPSTSPTLERWCAPAVAHRRAQSEPTPSASRGETRWAAGVETPVASGAERRRPVLDHGGRATRSRGLGRRSSTRTSATALLSARGPRRAAPCSPPPTGCARETCGDTVSYVVTRNVNYTNVCYFRCGFCAFSKGRLAASLRGPAVPRAARRDRPPRPGGLGSRRGRDLPPGRDPSRPSRARLPRDLPRREGRRARPARPRVLGARGLAGRGDARAAARRVPAAAPRRGPRLAARAPPRRSSTTRCARVLCPDKVTTAQWLEVHETAHRAGLRSTATIMFGHVDAPRHWARHLLARARPAAAHRRLHRARAAPVRAHGGADLPQGPRAPGPDLPRGAARPRRRRLALHPWITNVQASWVKLGVDGAQARAARRASTTSAGR